MPDFQPLLIVLAKILPDPTVVPIDPDDHGERHTYKSSDVPIAQVWPGEGVLQDLTEAREFARQQGYVVFTYPRNEPDPIGRGKTDVVTLAIKQLK